MYYVCHDVVFNSLVL
jgi:hypothetical protein